MRKPERQNIITKISDIIAMADDHMNQEAMKKRKNETNIFNRNSRQLHHVMRDVIDPRL